MAYTLKEKALLYHQLYTSCKAGLPMSMVLDAQTLPQAFRNKQTAMLPRLVEKGRPMSAALAYVKAITPWESRLLVTGEASGRVEQALADLENFFMQRHQQLSSMKAKLLYPLIVVVVGILAGPAPRLAAGDLSFIAYLLTAGSKLLLVYAFYQLVIVVPFEKATIGAFNPLLLKFARRVHNDHWLRQLFEVGYLNLLTTCLETGLPADESLKLLRDSSDDFFWRQQHSTAIDQIQKNGMSLNQALTGAGILRNYPIISFLSTAEQSGTLHSDLRQYVARRRGELDSLVRHKTNMFGKYLYIVILLLAVSGFF
ncbi:MAG: type II secretion system F family protein [Pseudomonadota bacterium]